ncbi:site-specific DNA-methyltransferase [candidate division WOR-3 bacterium]|nr:site-specific DNA-methyltransferase [candidate division WOR-3 bacterium]
MKTRHKVIIDDVRSAIKEVEDKSVQLVVTSPPYWNIKDYTNAGQIGFGQSYEDYIASLKEVWKESKRALSSGCKLIVNVGDQFLRAKDNDGKYEIVPIHTDIINTCKELGFIFLGNIIWQKISTTKTTGGCSWMGSIYFPRDGYITYEHEYIMIFKKAGKAPRPDEEMKELSRLPKEFRSKWFRGIWDDISPERQKNHVAMFPLEIPERLIRMFTFAGETVFDPFLGSGTTAEAAKKWNRNSVGIEINSKNIPLMQSRVKDIEVEISEKNERKVS